MRKVGEQLRRSGGGVDGAKAEGRGKHGHDPHALDSELGKCEIGTSLCTRANVVATLASSSTTRGGSRVPPKGPARICAGTQQWVCLPRSEFEAMRNET